MLKLLVRSVTAAFLISIVAIFIAVQTAQAAPASPDPFPLTQPDGTTFSARQWGDEWNNGVQTADGYSIIQDASTGYWVYAATAGSTSLSPALENGRPLVVGKDEPVDLRRGIRPEPSNQNPNNQPLASVIPSSQNFGPQKVLVLLVDFLNQAGTYTASDFASLFFGPANSVKSFYEQASRSIFSLTPAEETNGTADGVVGWLHMNYNHINTGGTTTQANRKLVKDALIAANSYVNYASFDTNQNGSISINELHIIVIVAGYEASYSPSSPSVWGHRWYLQSSDTPPTLDGVVLGSGTYGGGYAQFGEIHGNHIATIGIMAHELGHDISWPDLYDTSDVTEGVGEWSLMGSGSWDLASGYPGNSPALPDAWLRWYQGWQTPVQIKGLSTLTIDPIESGGNSYLLGTNPNGVDWNFSVKSGVGEYFLVENRQKISYDAGLPGCGLLIWHIDESKTSDNTANQGSHPLVFLEQADGSNHLMSAVNRGDGGDTFPGTLNKTSFTNLTNPNSNFYSGSDSGTRLVNISSTPAACSPTTPSSIKASLMAPGIGSGPTTFIPLIKTAAAAPTNRGIYGTVTDHGAALAGVQVQLRFYNGSAWSTSATTTTAFDGQFSFKNSPSLAPNQAYYVLFTNTENIVDRLSSWSTKIILTYTINQEMNIGNFDVENIVLASPLDGTHTPFPVTFNWTRRSSTVTDSYHLRIFLESDWTSLYDSGPLGYVSSKSVISAPPGTSFGSVYGWFLTVDSPDGGLGVSHYYYQITFSTSSVPPAPTWTDKTVLNSHENLFYPQEK